MKCRTHTTGDEALDRRLDKYLCEELQLWPRSQLEKRRVQVQWAGQTLKFSTKLKPGMDLDITWEDPPEVNYGPSEVALDILFENPDVVVVNKSRGLVVHPGAGHQEGTLAQGLLFHVETLAQAFETEESLRPGIVHRLDKDTTGVVITAKTPQALEALAQQFREKTTEKRYLAVIKGSLKTTRGEIQAPLARDAKNRQKFAVCAPGKGKAAHTLWKVLGQSEGYSLVELEPRTGRTHQLRVHLAHLGCPILGDPIYSKTDPRFPQAPLLLHARSLVIQLPGEAQPRRFEAPLPADWDPILTALGLIPRTPDPQTAGY